MLIISIEIMKIVDEKKQQQQQQKKKKEKNKERQKRARGNRGYSERFRAK